MLAQCHEVFVITHGVTQCHEVFIITHGGPLRTTRGRASKVRKSMPSCRPAQEACPSHCNGTAGGRSLALTPSTSMDWSGLGRARGETLGTLAGKPTSDCCLVSAAGEMRRKGRHHSATCSSFFIASQPKARGSQNNPGAKGKLKVCSKDLGTETPGAFRSSLSLGGER